MGKRHSHKSSRSGIEERRHHRRGQKYPKKKVVILCEGEKTETYYLTQLKRSFNDLIVNIDIRKGRTSSPEGLYKTGEVLLSQKDHGIDALFFVFDEDGRCEKQYEHYLAKIYALKAQEEATGPLIAPITSVPCFEVWILAHFCYTRRAFTALAGGSPCQQVVAEIIKQPGFTHYEKAWRDIYQKTADRLPQACDNARRALREHRCDGQANHRANSSTLMFSLVSFLQTANNQTPSEPGRQGWDAAKTALQAELA